MPCSEKRARQLLERKRATVKRIMPFVIILLDRTVEDCLFQPLEIKLDPGSKTTGICININQNGIIKIKGLYELIHRGNIIKKKLTQRAALRKARRSRKTRYRKPRFNNRTSKARKEGWLPPSI